MAITTVEQRSDAVTVGCACTGGTSSLRCRWSWLQCSITRTAPFGDRAQPPGPGVGARAELHGEDLGPPTPSRSSSAFSRKSPAECGQGRSRTLRRRRGLSGTSWSTGLKRAPSCRSSMLQCRRVGTSWWKRSGTSIRTSPSRLSKCPRSRLHPAVLAGAGFPWCRRRNSWWKCRNSCSWPFCSSNRWLTLLEVLKVFSLDRII